MPAHDMLPVKIHLESVSPEAGAALGGQAPRRRRRRMTRFGYETVDPTNEVRPILPDDPDRVIAWLSASGGDAILCGSEQDAKRATPAGSILPSANTAPWPVTGQGAVWAVQRVSTATVTVSWTADYEVDG
jgi:hypothetical protein